MLVIISVEYVNNLKTNYNAIFKRVEALLNLLCDRKQNMFHHLCSL